MSDTPSYKIIGADRREYGPVSAEDIRNWIAEGRADGKTSIKREGETDWKPLATFPEFAASVSVAPQLPPKLNAPVEPVELLRSVMERGVDVKIGHCIARGWQLVMRNFLVIVGSTFLIWLCQVAFGCIPYLGLILGPIMQGVLSGGLFWLLLKLIRGQAGSVGDAFAGFTENPVQLILASLIMGLLSGIAVVAVAAPFLFAFILKLWVLVLHASANFGNDAAAEAGWELLKSFGPFGVIGLLLAVAVSLFLATLWIFTLPLVIDQKLGFWQAMEFSRKVSLQVWLKLLGLYVLASLIAAAGILACCVGLFVTLPVYFAAIAYAYEDIFGRPVAKSA